MDKELRDRLDSLDRVLQETLLTETITGLTLLSVILNTVPEEKVDMEILKPCLKTIAGIVARHKEMAEIKLILKQAEGIIKKKQKGES